MKRGHKKLLIFEIILFIFLFLNSFVWNILDSYNNVVFLFISILLFKYIFGLEKDKHRYVKDVIYDILIVLLISFLLYYLFGVVIGFYRIDNYYNWFGIKTFILPLTLIIVLKEFLRYQMLNKADGSKLLIITTIMLFIFIDISTAIYYGNFLDSYNFFLFIALTLLPKISKNIVSSYITTKLGYKPNLVWLLLLELYVYLIPIVPNCNEYILSLIRFIFPLIILWKIESFFEKESCSYIERDYKKENKFIFVLPTLFVVLVVYFTSGYFKYYSVAIASGSMNPYISKGDVVIVENINKDYEEIEVGEVIAFKKDNVIVVHRVVNILEKENKYYFYTKGDSNKDMDNFSVHEEDIIGIVDLVIPYIGFPTVWLSEL